MNYQEWAAQKIDISLTSTPFDRLPEDLRDAIAEWAGNRGLYDLSSDEDMEAAKENFISNWDADYSAELRQEWIDRFGFDLDLDPKALDGLLGDGGTMPSANEFIAAGVSPTEYLNVYYPAGGFDIDRMKELLEAGFKTSDLQAQTDAGYGGYMASIGYKYCNGDLDIEEVKGIANA